MLMKIKNRGRRSGMVNRSVVWVDHVELEGSGDICIWICLKLGDKYDRDWGVSVTAQLRLNTRGKFWESDLHKIEESRRQILRGH